LHSTLAPSSFLLPPPPSTLLTRNSFDFCTADIISTVEFDYDGQHLATGDRGGRVVLFERVHPNVVSEEPETDMRRER
jgi:hypothetical protein